MIDIFNKSKLNNAFTLAEILVTLGVIGVIAAMTLPTVIASYKHKVLETQFKTAYTILSNAVRQITIDNPDLYYEMHNASTNEPSYKKLFPLLVSKLNVIENRADMKGRFNFSQKYRNYHNTQDSTYYFGIFGYFVLSNGMIIYPECSSGCNYIHIFVDINGDKPPNRAGHDLFDFELDSNNQLVPSVQFGTNCSLKGSSAGFDCTAQALSDKDYFKNLPR